MQIIAHRGIWKEECEKNSLESLSNALKKVYGVETDIRDYNGEIVISHGMPTNRKVLLSRLFDIYNGIHLDNLLALNIKADGLQKKLKVLIEKYNIKNYFLFDMSIPEMVCYKSEKMRFYTRQSDIESECVMYKYADGVWIDGFFEYSWLTFELIVNHIDNGKFVSIVSPDIHGQDKNNLWRMIKENNLYKYDRLMLCTDYPDEAKRFFE